MIAIGLIAQSREFLAVHRHAVEPPFRTDTGVLPELRMGAWNAWASHAGADRVTSPSAGSPETRAELVLDARPVARVERVRPGHVRLRFDPVCQN
jgi:hypothetical protein